MTGADCSDQSKIRFSIPDIFWSSAGGVWNLVGCPPGKYLSSQPYADCNECPAAYYCAGSNFPPTPCRGDLYSPPGSLAFSSCYAVVYVVATVEVNILRPIFSDDTVRKIQSVLSEVTKKDSKYIIITNYFQSNVGITTIAALNIATSNSREAANQFFILNSSAKQVRNEFAKQGLNGSTLQSIAVTACVPGFELVSGICQICQSTFYCPGDFSSKVQCADGYFSLPGSQISTDCYRVLFVAVTVSFPANLTLDILSKFRIALAFTANVSEEYIIASVLNPSRRLLDQKSKIIAIGEIAVNDSKTALLISNWMQSDSLWLNLKSVGLPIFDLESVVVSGAAPQNVGSALSLQVVIGTSIAALVVCTLITLSIYQLIIMFKKQAFQRSFLAKFQIAKAGQIATNTNLPYMLLKYYTPEKVLGRGAFGCVVQARTKDGTKAVAIKIVVPQKGIFEAKELRQLNREAKILEMFSIQKCEHTVQLAGVKSVSIMNDLCWFIMDLLDGQNMEDVIYNSCGQSGDCSQSGHSIPSAKRHVNPVNDLECIKVSRNVLAVLKLMHSEGVLHRDIKPANLMRCRAEKLGEAWDGASYAYKLIDFGTALGIDETVAKEFMMTLVGSRDMAAGTLPYMSPEMFKEPDNASYPTDLWSIGVSMFEMVTASLPFEAESEMLWSIAIAGSMTEPAPNVLDRLDEERRSTFDGNLAKVIGKALQKRVRDRFTSVDEMHQVCTS